MGTVKSRGCDQDIVTFPHGMRDRLKAAARANGRSLNSEIVHRLMPVMTEFFGGGGPGAAPLAIASAPPSMTRFDVGEVTVEFSATGINLRTLHDELYPEAAEAERERLERSLLGTDYSTAPEGVRQLPRSMWQFDPYPELLVVSAWARGRNRVWRRLPIGRSDLQQTLTGWDNLERAILALADGDASGQPVHDEPGEPDGGTPHGR